MEIDTELFSRDCQVSSSNGSASALTVRFFSPVKNPSDTDYLARANISCPFFDKDVYATGEDAPQAFFSLPYIVTSYLIGQRRYGYETYWGERGDLDLADFWTYQST